MVLILLLCSLPACGDANGGNKETTPSVNSGNDPEDPNNSNDIENNNENEHDFTRVFTLDSLEPLSVEMQAEVEAVWKEKTGEKLLWCGARLSNGKINAEDRYYGTFNDCVVVFHIVAPFLTVVGRLEVGGQTLVHGTPFEIWIYSDNTFISIKEAYENGILTDVDISKIIEYHNDFFEYLQNKQV